MVYKYECNAMRKGSSFLPHSSVQLSASAESRQQSVCVCRRAQLFFYLRAKERERKVTRLLTWPLIAGINRNIGRLVKWKWLKKLMVGPLILYSTLNYYKKMQSMNKL